MRSGPDYIQFYPTLRCNRSCAFCFNQSIGLMDDMSSPSFHRMLEQLPSTVKALDIIGGEPTQHPAIVSFAQAASQSGLRVNLSSNGSNLNVLEQVRQVAPDATIGISINDRETLNEVSRFISETAAVVKMLYSRGLDSFLVHDIVELQPKAFYYIYRDATGPHDLPETLPFPEFLSEVSKREPHQAGTVYCSGFVPDTAAYPDLASVRCPAGTTKLGIMPDGSVYPCNLLFNRHELLLGNILIDPFEAIWNHPALAFFRRFSTNACPKQSCALHAQCHGGCPAQSLILTGDLNAHDPRCILG